MPSALTVLSYLLQAAPYAAAALLGVLVPTLGVVCYSRFGAGVAVVFLMFAVEALYMYVGGLQLGIVLYATDFVLVFIGAVAGLRLLVARDLPRRHWAWFVFGLVFFASLGLGLASYGTGAGVQARPYFYFLVAWTYGMTFEIDARRLRLILNSLVALAVLLLCIIAYRWTVYYLPIRELLPEGGVYNNDGPIRVIRSYEAIVLGQVLILGLFLPQASRGLVLARVLAPLLLGAVIVLQHRSVWLATIAGALGAILLGGSRTRGSAGQLVLIVAIVSVTALPLVLDERLSGVNEQLGASAGSALAGGGTTGERAESWSVMIGQWWGAGPRSIAIGQSFGTDPSRYVHEQDGGGVRKIVYGAHNFYVQTLFSTGLVGLLSFLVAAGFVVRGLYRICASGTEGPEADALLILILMQLVYYVPYGTDYLQSLLFGVALAYVATHERKRAAAAAADTRPMRRFPPSSRWA